VGRASQRPPRKRALWLILGVVAVLIIATLTGLAIWRSNPAPHPAKSDIPTTPAAPMVAPDRLNLILFGAPEINGIMGTSDMQISTDSTELDKDPAAVSNPNCIGAQYAGKASEYQGSGYISVSRRRLLEPVANPDHSVDESAVAFASAAEATAFAANSAAKWKACAGQTVTETGTTSGPPRQVTFGDLTGEVPKIAISHTSAHGSTRGKTCQHALIAVANLVVDVAACGEQITDEASQIADGMAATAMN
jgi:serine/threonine-protein kinase